MEKPLKIKVCGLRDPGNIEQVCRLEPEFAGFIFYEGSKRFVGHRPDPAIFRIPGPQVSKVGVFVNEEIPRVRHIFETLRLDLVQLHGTESAAYCRSLKEYGLPVMKAIDPVSLGPEKKSRNSKISGISPEIVSEARFLIFDTPGKGFGGSGNQFNWKLLESYQLNVQFLLSGGIGPGDAQAISGLRLKNLFGVDINSRFESSPGMKNIELLEKFFSEIRK